MLKQHLPNPHPSILSNIKSVAPVIDTLIQAPQGFFLCKQTVVGDIPCLTAAKVVRQPLMEVAPAGTECTVCCSQVSASVIELAELLRENVDVCRWKNRELSGLAKGLGSDHL